ncbi:hypothetical protein BgiMline_030243 [Biomphalaria glabrata]|nr:hypothetical protein BgiMline_032805 [Biomphalaria glabrata]
MDSQTNSCQPCTPAPEDNNAIAEYACNSTHNAKYRCKDEFFNLDGSGNLVCQKCRECKDTGLFVVKNCSAEQDTECCGHETGADELCISTTPRNRISTTTSLNMTSTPDAKRVTDNQTSTSHATIIATNQGPTRESTDIGLMCNRNEHVDMETNSCKPCDLCSYVDHDLHSLQKCDPCTEGENHSRLASCPKQCFSKEDSVGWIALSFLLGVIFLSLTIALVVSDLLKCCRRYIPKRGEGRSLIGYE